MIVGKVSACDPRVTGQSCSRCEDVTLGCIEPALLKSCQYLRRFCINLSDRSRPLNQSRAGRGGPERFSGQKFKLGAAAGLVNGSDGGQRQPPCLKSRSNPERNGGNGFERVSPGGLPLPALFSEASILRR